MAVDGLAEQVRSAVEQRFPSGLPDDLAAAEIAKQFVDFLGVVVGSTQGLPAAARAVGRVCTVNQAATWTTLPGKQPKSDEAIRKAVREHRLVGFRTDDGHYLLPVWQFDSDGAMLTARPDVIAVWQSLPHDASVTSRYLATWMNNAKRSMDGNTVAEQAHLRGANHPSVTAAVSAVWARLAPGRVAPDAA